MSDSKPAVDFPVSATPTSGNDKELLSNNIITQTEEGEKQRLPAMTSTAAAAAENATPTSSSVATINGNIANIEKVRALEDADADADEDELSENNIKNATAGEADLTRTTSTIQYVEGMKFVFLMASLTLIFFLVMVDISIVATAVPNITSEFNSLEDVGWYGTAYQLACAALQPLAGKVYSNFRSKYVYLFCFFIFEVGSLLCGVAQSSTMLIIGRAVAGIGSSGLMNGGLTILSASMPLHKRPLYFGIMMGFAQMGTVLGPILGGAFTSYVNWRWCFYINLPVGGVAGLILLLFIDVPEMIKPRTLSILEIIRKKLDIVGFILFAPAAIQVFLALEWGGNKYDWNSATIIGLFCGSGATTIVFGIWEYYQGDNAMTPFSILKIRNVWTSCFAMFLFLGCLQTAAYYLPMYFQTVRGNSPMVSGVHYLPNVLAQLFSTVASGVLVGRLGYYLPFMSVSAALSAVSLGLISTFTPDTSTGKWIGYQLLLGFSRGLGMQMPLIAVQNSIDMKFVPVSMALVAFGQTFGGAVFLAVSETILTNQLRINIPKYAPGVNTAAVIAAGGSGPAVAAAVGNNPAGLMGTLYAYSESIDAVYWFAAGAACLMFVVSFGMGWKDIRKKDSPGASRPTPKTDIENPPITATAAAAAPEPAEAVVAANAETGLSTGAETGVSEKV